MTTQPEALRLADALEMSSNHGIRRDAAAELRRLYAELRRLQIDSDALGVHLSERMKDLFKVEAQRDALLEALKAAEPYLRHANVAYNVYVQARAAIKQAEGENT